MIGYASDFPEPYDPLLDGPPNYPPDDQREHRAALEFYTLAELCKAVDAAGPRRFLIRGIWPTGSYGVLAGEMKTQKSWHADDLAVSVASGTPWLNLVPIDHPGPVLMFAGEGGRESVVRRIRAICADRKVTAEDLPIDVCVRAPHLAKDQHLDEFRRKVEDLNPRLVILDPFYLSAGGAKGGSLYDMGEVLERAQHICEPRGAALLVVTHYNRSTGKGPARISGAGPAEWGRVLLLGHVVHRSTDDDGTSHVTTDLTVVGGEVPDKSIRVQRTIHAEDPDDLNSPLRYEVQVVERTPGDEADDMPPARRKLLEAVTTIATAADPKTRPELVDWIAEKYGHGLTRTTVSGELGELFDATLVDKIERPGTATLWFPTRGVGIDADTLADTQPDHPWRSG